MIIISTNSAKFDGNGKKLEALSSKQAEVPSQKSSPLWPIPVEIIPSKT